jgi:hypothetical protein
MADLLIVENKGGEIGEGPNRARNVALFISNYRYIAKEVEFPPVFA